MGSVLLGNIFSDLVGWLGDTITALTDWLDDIAGEWWFLLVILAIAFFDSVIPLVPSETAVIIGGVAAGQGDQVLPLVILCGAAGRLPGRQLRLPDRPALQPGDQPTRRVTAEDSAASGMGQQPDPRPRWSAADHGPVHPRWAHRPDGDVGSHPSGPRLVRSMDRPRRGDLGDLRRRCSATSSATASRTTTRWPSCSPSAPRCGSP